MAVFRPSALYPIVNVVGGRAPGPALDRAEAVLSAGVAWIQLRAKELPASVHLDIARELVARAARFGAGVIVNDRLDVALVAQAAGVHLGQTDLPAASILSRAREAGLVVGVSTHDVAQARAAQRDGADYIGFGPMFATATKANALSPRRAGLLSDVRAAVALPIVAIGGIKEETASGVLDAGANAVAMIGALADSKDPAGLARRVLASGT